MRNQIVLILCAALLALTLAAAPDARSNLTSGLTEKGVGLAAHGFDVVAFFTKGQPVAGTGRHTAVYRGGAYRFASAEHLRLFEQNPARYAPQYGGFCAYGVYAGAKFDGNPLLWRIVDGKLYFNLNEEIQAKWLQDVPGHIAKADQNWRRIADQDPADLK